MNTHSDIILQMKCWLKSVIIDLNICPFANHEFINDRIHYSVCKNTDLEMSLFKLANEFQLLESNIDIETTLLIFPDTFSKFDEFLLLIDYANKLITDLNYDSVFQLAHFHPEYYFEGVEPDDASNYTNRSPFPTLHLLREESLQKAIEKHADTSTIPETNIKLTRKMGIKKMHTLLQKCMKPE